MYINSIQISGFGPYRDVPVEYNFDLPITSLTGKNGSGKTSVLDAIMWCLYGKPAARIDNDMGSVTNTMTAETNVVLSLEDDSGNPMTISRSYMKGEDSSHSLNVKHGKINKTTITTAQKYINEIMGMDYTTFKSLAVVDQHSSSKMGSIVTSTPSERRDIIASIMPEVERWTSLNKKVVNNRRSIKRMIKDIDTDIDRTDKEISNIIVEDIDVPSKEDLDNAVREMKKAENSSRTDRLSLQNELKTVDRKLKEAEESLNDKKDLLNEELMVSVKKWNSYYDSENKYKNNLSEIEKIDKQISKAPEERIRKLISYAHQDIDRLEHSDGECPMCSKKISDAKINEIIDNLRSIIDDYPEEEIEVDLLKVRKENFLLENKKIEDIVNNPPTGRKVEEIEDEIRNLSDPEYEKLKNHKDTITDKLSEDDTSELTLLRNKVNNIRDLIDDHSEIVENRKRRKELTDKKNELIDKAEELEKRLSAIEILAEATMSTGIPAHAIEKKAHSICDKANKILSDIGSPHLTISVEISEAEKMGKLIPVMNLVVGEGISRRDVMTLSSGEQARVIAAMSLGTAIDESNFSGIVIMDEPLAMIDDDLTYVFNDIIVRIVESSMVEQVILSSRADDVVNQIEINSNHWRMMV